MGQEISTAGGAIATAATALAAGFTLGLVEELNNAVVDCANFTKESAEKTVVAAAGETVVHACETSAVAVAVVATLGLVESLNNSVVACANKTAGTAETLGTRTVTALDEISDAVPVLGQGKAVVLYACGETERGDRAIKASCRSTGVILGGVAGLVTAGPPGAIAGGIAVGAAIDGITTGIDSAVNGEYRPAGQIEAWTHVARNESPSAVVRGVVGALVTTVADGTAGVSLGKSVVYRINRIRGFIPLEHVSNNWIPLQRLGEVGEELGEGLGEGAEAPPPIRPTFGEHLFDDDNFLNARLGSEGGLVDAETGAHYNFNTFVDEAQEHFWYDNSEGVQIKLETTLGEVPGRFGLHIAEIYNGSIYSARQMIHVGLNQMGRVAADISYIRYWAVAEPSTVAALLDLTTDAWKTCPLGDLAQRVSGRELAGVEIPTHGHAIYRFV